MRSPYRPPQVEKQVADLSEQVPEAARRAASICASCRWSPSTVKTHATSMTPYCEKNVAAAGACVAIADVSYYVRPRTALDDEARSRGNSVYFRRR